MHGLVLLDENNEVLRNAILWNDTRTTAECQEIYNRVGRERLLSITKNIRLEGFTLPKILWVKKHEPDIFKKAKSFVLPKDYVRYKLTGKFIWIILMQRERYYWISLKKSGVKKFVIYSI